jgi:hypothetical protein
MEGLDGVGVGKKKEGKEMTMCERSLLALNTSQRPRAVRLSKGVGTSHTDVLDDAHQRVSRRGFGSSLSSLF